MALSMSTSILELCDPSKRLAVAKGSVLLQEGVQTGHLYVLADGTIDVLRGGTVVASTSEPGAIFGEMSVLLGTPHTATVQARTHCDVYVFEDAAGFVREHPELTFQIATLLARRLNQATTYITDLNETVRAAGHIWSW